MIDPVIVSFELFGRVIALRWYGVLVMSAVLVGSWITERQIRKRGGDAVIVTDALPIVLIAGVLGARLWYVLNATLGGSRYFVDNPVKILAIPEGGLHIYGAFLIGGAAAIYYLRRRGVDFWLLLDSVAPALLIGQAFARPANFINQELYGPPTEMPWGIPIDALHRMPPWDDLARFPLETTRFHPTFAYEMIWNLLAGGLLLWIGRRFEKNLKPGMIFAGWMILAGLGRFVIEAFRPDQPRIPGTDLSYSALVAGLVAVIGILWLLARLGILRIDWLNWGPAQYGGSSK